MKFILMKFILSVKIENSTEKADAQRACARAARHPSPPRRSRDVLDGVLRPRALRADRVVVVHLRRGVDGGRLLAADVPSWTGMG
jgi:hypothetical protein